MNHATIGKGSMKESLLKIKKIKNILLSLNTQIIQVENDLSLVRKDLDYLEHLEKALVDNIKFLKKDKIIALVGGYKEAIEQLNKVNRNIAYYMAAQEKLSKDLVKLRENFEENKKQYNQAIDVEKNEKVILIFKPRKIKTKK